VQLEVVKDYYGKMLKSSKDLKSSACCDGGAELPPHLQPLLANVHPEVSAKYHGCCRPSLAAGVCSISARARAATPIFWRSW
jgi:hypothetical protein